MALWHSRLSKNPWFLGGTSQTKWTHSQYSIPSIPCMPSSRIFLLLADFGVRPSTFFHRFWTKIVRWFTHSTTIDGFFHGKLLNYQRVNLGIQIPYPMYPNSWTSIPIGSMYAIYLVTCTINIPPMVAYVYHTWILWDIKSYPEDFLSSLDQG